MTTFFLFFATSQVPTLVDKMIAGGTTNRRVSSCATDNLTALMKRPWEATVALTSFQRPVSLQMCCLCLFSFYFRDRKITDY